MSIVWGLDPQNRIKGWKGGMGLGVRAGFEATRTREARYYVPPPDTRPISKSPVCQYKVRQPSCQNYTTRQGD